MTNTKPLLGIIGFSDGDLQVHEQLKEIVQKQVDVIAEELRKDGRVDVIVADNLVYSVQTAVEERRSFGRRCGWDNLFLWSICFP